MQSDVNFPLVLCKPTSQIIQPKFNQCKRFVLHPHFSFIYLTISILGSSTIFGLSFKYTLRFVPSNWVTRKNQQNEKQILCNKFCYPTTIFPVTFTSRTIFTGGKKKDVLLVYGCQPKPIHKYKFIHLRIYILMDWMN